MQFLLVGCQAYQSLSAGLVQSARGPLSTLPGSCGVSGPGVLYSEHVDLTHACQHNVGGYLSLEAKISVLRSGATCCYAGVRAAT